MAAEQTRALAQDDQTPPLTQLVIKPTIYCFHNCSYCTLRQEYYQQIRANGSRRARLASAKRTSLSGTGHIPLRAALRAIDEAAALGMTSLQLSGGDPLRYRHLVTLIRAGAGHDGVFVFMNSVGSGVTLDKAKAILDAGLGAWNFSIDTLDEHTYDRLRGVRGGLRNVLTVVDTVRRAAAGRSGVYLNYMVVITADNYRALPDLLAHCVDTGIASMYLMPVYGASTAPPLLDAGQVRQFRDRIVPEMLQVLADKNTPELVQSNAASVLGSLYPRHHDDNCYERGAYWPDHGTAIRGCRSPLYQMTVLPNLNVLPCCQVEVAHTEQVGNLATQTLTDIWRGQAYQRFRAERIPFCQSCSAPQARTLGLVESMCRQFHG